MFKELALPVSAFLFLFFINCRIVHGQTTLRGQVTDEKGQPLPDVNILLLRVPDSALVKGTISSSSGAYFFENVHAGRYLLSYTFSGMKTIYKMTQAIGADDHSIDLAALRMQSAAGELGEVTVSARKPLFEQKPDRMVINVKNSITNAGGSALDVLEKSPGVQVNRQTSSISMLGKNGVVIMINGKRTYMPADAVIQLLEGTNAGNIEKIELITAPPSKYDAEGNAGYINIVLINNPYAGVNGSYFISGGYGKRENSSAGANFTYRSGKISFFGNYSFARNHQIQNFGNFRQLSDEDTLYTDRVTSYRNGVMLLNNLRAGLDYQLTTSTTMGVLLTGYDSRWTMTANNVATEQKGAGPDTVIHIRDNEVNHWQNYMANFNFQHTFRPGEVLYLDANYIYYRNSDPNTYEDTYSTGNDDLLYDQQSMSGKTTPIHFRVFSADYSRSVKKNFTLEAGGKVSLSRFNNDIGVQDDSPAGWIIDTGFSANYLLKENILAGYLSGTLSLDSKTSVKAGLRYEHTTSNLGTEKQADIVDRKYGEFFPTLTISRNTGQHGLVTFSYGRRINRPSFNDLAPYTIFFDPTTYFTGNPALQPAIANSVQASYSYRNYILSVGYTYEQHSIAGFQNKVDTTTHTQFIAAYNYKYVKTVSASLAVPVAVTRWWKMQNNLTANYLRIDIDPGYLQTIDLNISSTQSISLPSNYSLEATGYYYSASYSGTQRYRPIYRVDAGLQKKFGNNILRLTATDIFNSGGLYRFNDHLPVESVVINGQYNMGLMAYRLTFTHNFGNSSLKARKERATGAEEELNRVHK